MADEEPKQPNKNDSVYHCVTGTLQTESGNTVEYIAQVRGDDVKALLVKIRSDRLRRLFYEVWERIPEDDRQTLLSGLQPYCVVEDCELPGEKKYGFTIIKLGDDGKVYQSVWLNSEALATDDQHAKNVIAHELAHVFCMTGEDINAPDLVMDMDADNRARRWGFKSDALFSLILQKYGHENMTPEERASAVLKHLPEMAAIIKQWNSRTQSK